MTLPQEAHDAGTRLEPLIYSMGVSLGGFIAGPNGEIDWGAPYAELLRFHNHQTQEIGAHLCGRGLYQAMLAWETADETRWNPQELEFARIWKAIPKVVFSTTLATVEGNARLARLREQPGEGVVSVGGAGFASTLIKLGLIDEYRLFTSDYISGSPTSPAGCIQAPGANPPRTPWRAPRPRLLRWGARLDGGQRACLCWFKGVYGLDHMRGLCSRDAPALSPPTGGSAISVSVIERSLQAAYL
jgi:dihydrofolate reductase